MKKSIYNVFILIESQEQADRMLEVCKEYGLPYWNNKVGWNYGGWHKTIFSFDEQDKEFFCYNAIYTEIENETQVTESEFIELLKQEKLKK